MSGVVAQWREAHDQKYGSVSPGVKGGVKNVTQPFHSAPFKVNTVD